MNKRFRYGLLAVGFVFFLVASPLIVLYVRGMTYDFSTRRFVHTGLLAIRTNPKKISIFLDGKKIRSGSGDVKFLRPKEYEIKISAPGYFDWVKHLRVNSGQVTWVGNNTNKTYLLKENGLRQDLVSSVSDFCLVPGKLFALSKNFLVQVSLSDNAEKTRILVPAPAELITCAQDGSLALITGGGRTQLFSADKNTFLEISSLFPAGAQFSLHSNTPYALFGGTVFRINPETGGKIPLAQNVKFFSSTDSFIYYAAAAENRLELYAKNLSTLAATALGELPLSQEGFIYVTPGRQVFVQTAQRLYRVNSTPEIIAENISALDFDPSNGNLVTARSGELDRYDHGGQNWIFVTRSSQPLGNMVQRDDVGYLFVIKGLSLAALELDNRDSSNEFNLFTGGSLKKFFMDENAVHAYILDGQNLLRLEIR